MPPLSSTQLSEKEPKIPSPDISADRSLVGQLNWLPGISRTDISFNVCNIDAKISKMEVRDVTLLNEIIKHMKSEEYQACFPSLDKIKISTVE